MSNYIKSLPRINAAQFTGGDDLITAFRTSESDETPVWLLDIIDRQNVFGVKHLEIKRINDCPTLIAFRPYSKEKYIYIDMYDYLIQEYNVGYMSMPSKIFHLLYEPCNEDTK